MTYRESEKKLDGIRNTYGEFVFRGAIGHLCDVGTRHLTADIVAESKASLNKEERERPLISNEFICAVLDCAYELAQIQNTHFLKYLTKKVKFTTVD